MDKKGGLNSNVPRSNWTIEMLPLGHVKSSDFPISEVKKICQFETFLLYMDVYL